jgi:hypothetical protein
MTIIWADGKGSSGFSWIFRKRREELQKRGMCAVNQRSGVDRRCWSCIFEIVDTSCRKEMYFRRGRGGCESGGRERQILSGIFAVEMWTRV